MDTSQFFNDLEYNIIIYNNNINERLRRYISFRMQPKTINSE